MIALKFLESHTQRDQLVLMLISYFLVFAGLLREDTALSGVYLLVFVWLTTVGLMQLGRRGDLMRTRVTTTLAGRMLLQSVPIMIALFVLFPRLPGPLWQTGDSEDAGSTGLSDSMAPGDITDLGLSDEIAFRVAFADSAPAAQDLYWRGPVLAEFDGRTWTPRRGMWLNARNTLSFRGEPIQYTVSLEPGKRRWAFALEMPAEWSTSRRRNIVMRSDYQLVTFGTEPPASRLSYDVTSYSDFTAAEPLTASQQAVYLRLPVGYNPRTAELMDALRRDADGPREIVDRALSYFSDGEFFYTLTPPALGRDSVDDFLFATKEGFCEHYASAFAVMMRFAGIPARVVTGYHGAELNPYGQYYIVREYNAHAWTEVWLQGRGWVRVDPVGAVAPERIALGIADGARLNSFEGGNGAEGSSWMRKAAFAWDAINTAWNDWVVGYDLGLQRDLFEWLGLGRLRWTTMFTLSIAATFAIVVVTALALAWYARTRERVDMAAKLFARFVRRLRRLGVPACSATEDPAAYARRAAATIPSRAGEIGAFVQTYLRARYESDPDGRNLAQLRELLRSFTRNAAPA
jgi:transglutaminase-like putative cysteine protease